MRMMIRKVFDVHTSIWVRAILVNVYHENMMRKAIFVYRLSGALVACPI